MSSRRLASYIERLQSIDPQTSHPPDRPFNNATAKKPPLLQPHGVNHVLLFPGSFNPPHQGHLDLLKHVFDNAGADLNIIAAIIIVTDDDRLEMKMKDKDTSIILPREQRVNLWRGNGIPVDWAWVYDNTEVSWPEFRANLVRELRRDRIELKFMLLCGPDAITGDGGYNPECWDCPDSITSDVSRPVDFRYPNTLRQLAGCTPWEKLRYDGFQLEQQIRVKFKGQRDSGQSSLENYEMEEANRKTAAETELTKVINKLDVISVCRQQRAKKRGTVRFLPCNLEKRPSDAPSSTKIRKIIERSPQGELKGKLEGVALHPELLVEYLKDLTSPIKRVPLKEEAEKKVCDNIV
ncbi:hypothetical protein FHETE_7365 [Fusarium heterosporum]|uniref:Cytidyltransferase-like domain-containing protein n=1 Tax=Fusarium heterosporum TaxID=42747 RepID=A0A8H5T6S1_FUSHE|nr:hypothetical protein FHETE_7365 [Fusarium heterosporum]